MDSCKMSKWELVLGAPDRVNISDDFTSESKYGFDIQIITIKVPSGTVVVTHLFVKKILVKKT